jgi:inner membrane protein
MDPFSQAGLGAVVGQAVGQRQLGHKAALVGAVVGALPDVDVLFSINGDFVDQLVTHRGITHSLFFVAITGPLLGALVYLQERRRGSADDPARRRRWMLVTILALLSHPLLDLFTTYGTQLLLPFSNERFAIDAMPIIDPLFTAVLAIGLVLAGLVARASRTGAARVAWLTIVISCGYLGYGWLQGQRAESAAARQLADAGIAVDRIAAFPTLLQVHLRRVVARSGEIDRVGFYSTWSPCPIDWQAARNDRQAADRYFLGTREGSVFDWFTMGWAHYRVETAAATGARLLIASDLRYGFADAPLESVFTLKARLQPDGSLSAPAQAGRTLPTDARTTLAWLLESTYAPACRLFGTGALPGTPDGDGAVQPADPIASEASS